MVQLSWVRVIAPLLLLAALASGQEGLDWNSSKFFRYNILSVTFNSTTRAVTVVFSVSDPENGNARYDILNTSVPPYKTSAGARLVVLTGWNTEASKTELLNTGNVPVGQVIPRNWMNSTPPTAGGTGPSVARSINALTAAKRCDSSGAPCASFAPANLTFYVTPVLPAEAVGAGRVGIEGHAVRQNGFDATGQPVYVSIPIRSAVADFGIDATGVARREVVDFAKCQKCHDDGVHGDVTVPRLSLHGGNRTEEPRLCVMCHNANQTDAAYRSSGAEVSVDFKSLVHGIHSARIRTTPLVIIGHRGSVNNYSGVRFPGELKNCLACHIDRNGKGTFELPLVTTLGSTINSVSALNPLPGFIDVNPQPDLRISPIAAACSACHTKSEDRRHMISGGASFEATQTALAGKERCVNCHGPGGVKDVRRVHR